MLGFLFMGMVGIVIYHVQGFILVSCRCVTDGCAQLALTIRFTSCVLLYLIMKWIFSYWPRLYAGAPLWLQDVDACLGSNLLAWDQIYFQLSRCGQI